MLLATFEADWTRIFFRLLVDEAERALLVLD